MTRRVLVHERKADLAAAVADEFISLTRRLATERTEPIHVALTGGSMGIATLEALRMRAVEVPWSRLQLWWGDERWLPAGDSERNEQQAHDALLAHIEIPAANVHRFAASDSGLSLDEAATRYAEELAEFSAHNFGHPVFDLVLLGVGPDGHIASLFPERAGIEVTDRTVIGVTDSPKPPAERLSLTRPVLNSAAHVWLVLAGSDKAAALGLALAGASRSAVPVAGIKGREETVYFVDQEAARNVPANVAVRFVEGDRVGRD